MWQRRRALPLAVVPRGLQLAAVEVLVELWTGSQTALGCDRLLEPQPRRHDAAECIQVNSRIGQGSIGVALLKGYQLRCDRVDSIKRVREGLDKRLQRVDMPGLQQGCVDHRG